MTKAPSIHRLVQDFLSAEGNKKLNAEKKLLKALDHPSIRSEEYANRNRYFLSAHKLMAYEQCPYLTKLQHIDLIPPPIEVQNDNFLLGSGVEDAIVLTEEKFEEKYAVVKMRSAKAKEENEGKELLTEGQAATIKECRREFHSSPFTPGKLVRKNIIAPYSGYVLKAELDHFDEERGVPVDLKTTANLNTFEKDFHVGSDLFERYVFQQAFYSFVYELRYGTHFDQAELFVVDKYEWSRSHKFVLGYNSILKSRYDRIESLISQWKDSEESGIWAMVDLSTLEGRMIFRNSPYWLSEECQSFKSSIPASVF